MDASVSRVFASQTSHVAGAAPVPEQSSIGDVEQAQPSSPVRKENNSLRTYISGMLVSGAVFDFLSDTIYKLLPGKADGLDGLLRNKWATWALTMGTLFAAAIPPTCSKTNRDALKALNTRFAMKLVVPSVMDLLVTGTRLVAIVYMSPSVVAIIKICVNILVLALINVWNGKSLLCKQWIALHGCFCGLLIVCAEDAVFARAEAVVGDDRRQTFGIGFAVLCGILGGFRNTVEEKILQGDNFPDGALLMVESWCSCVLLIPVYFILECVNRPDDPGAIGLVQDPVILVLLVFFAITSWGKDAGKLKVTKYGSAILVKVVALLFPFGTWILSLSAYPISVYLMPSRHIGESWTGGSFIRLAGFCVILLFAYIFSSSSKGKASGTVSGSSSKPASATAQQQ